MKVIRVVFLIPVIVLASLAAGADDLTGSSKFLCAAVQTTQCFDGGDCEIDLPWNLNMPQFVEIDLAAKIIRTTKASGENRQTPIEHLETEEGMIALQGFELEKGFTFVIDERTGRATIAIATRGQAIIVFGVCTPMASADGQAE